MREAKSVKHKVESYRIDLQMAIAQTCTFSVLLFAFCLSCSSTSKEDSNKDAWEVSISGKVGFPQQGQILIQEIKNGALGWQDTVKLKSNYTYSKKIKLSQPGYYKITFFNRQYVDFILFKSNIEINVDGNDPNGFAEIKGSPEIDIIRKTQTILRDVESSPEMAKLSQEFSEAAQVKNETKMAELQATYMKEVAKGHEKVAQLLKDEPPSLGVINLLQSKVIDPDQHFDTYLEVATKLQQEWPDYEHAKAFIGMVHKMKSIAIGARYNGSGGETFKYEGKICAR
jgi:Domain of unknown function (DUF4369)